RLADAQFQQCWSQPDGEAVDLDVDELGRDEMSEFVNEDQGPDEQDERQEVGKHCAQAQHNPDQTAPRRELRGLGWTWPEAGGHGRLRLDWNRGGAQSGPSSRRSWTSSRTRWSTCASPTRSTSSESIALRRCVSSNACGGRRETSSA